jgi:hypothetical protein
VGCLRNVQLNLKNLGEPLLAVGIIPCSEKVESGVFFSSEGGQIIACEYHQSYRVCKIVIALS